MNNSALEVSKMKSRMDIISKMAQKPDKFK